MSGGMRLIHGACEDILPTLLPNSVHMVLADLPYGTTSCKWDSILDLPDLWYEYRRILKPNGVIALTASQPFTSKLVMSNPEMFRHEWIWIKNAGSNFANTVREPMKEHESVLIFSAGKWTYNKQMQERAPSGLARAKHDVRHDTAAEVYREFEGRDAHDIGELRVPSSWQKFNRERGLHPTQKPVLLMRYMILTYTNPGETVLDNCMGSGTTGVACADTGREFIGIESDATHFATAEKRLTPRAA